MTTFGYVDVGVFFTVPFTRADQFGSWNIHGGVNFLGLGDTTKAFKLPRGSQGGRGDRVDRHRDELLTVLVTRELVN